MLTADRIEVIQEQPQELVLDVQPGFEPTPTPNTGSNQMEIDTLSPKTLLISILRVVGNKTLAGIDFIGEKVAGILGITAPKYGIYIDAGIEQEKQMVKQQEYERLAENARWIQAQKSGLMARNDSGMLEV
ncbi:hypothetical protein BKA69DRAFT_1078935 [Paraphysoderma sedebokerense]|nr:hypothetical protein BKA69DRAFT_1078935 [Paraphysoderma sedebokerense]